VSDEYRLEKLIWTEEDLDKINLNHAYVHAYGEVMAQVGSEYTDLLPKPLAGSVAEEYYKANHPTAYWGRQLVFDIDYSLRRSDFKGQPQEPDDYTYWLAPAILVFEYAEIIELYINQGAPILRSLERYTKQPAPEDALPGWMWILKGDFCSIRLNATGLKLYFRKQPVISDDFALRHDERGRAAFHIEMPS
jgi:hypothetical protein